MIKNFPKGWHVLYVKSRHEKKVHDLLLDVSLDSFLPMIKTTRKWSDRMKTSLKPLFPSYVFVNIKSSRDFHKALSVRSEGSFVRFGTKYARVSETDMCLIKLLTSSTSIKDVEVGVDLPLEGSFKVVNEGALLGLKCKVLNVNNKNKIVVRIESIQQNICVTIPVSYLSDLKTAV
ncbi:MAG: antitermination protein NusG [Kordia sp.]|nr:MAG: antitermination protein NusG [Kordia sp.]